MRIIMTLSLLALLSGCVSQYQLPSGSAIARLTVEADFTSGHLEVGLHEKWQDCSKPRRLLFLSKGMLSKADSGPQLVSIPAGEKISLFAKYGMVQSTGAALEFSNAAVILQFTPSQDGDYVFAFSASQGSVGLWQEDGNGSRLPVDATRRTYTGEQLFDNGIDCENMT